MYTVAILGNERNTLLSSFIVEALSTLGKTVYVSSGAITEKGSGSSPTFLICDTNILNHLEAENAVTLLKDQMEESSAQWEELHCPVLVNSSNKEGLARLANKNIQTITCGLSQKDSITFSSYAEDNGVICIQRIIHRLDGASIEPMEIPVKLKKHPAYHCLCLYTILLLCGCDTMFDTIIEKL